MKNIYLIAFVTIVLTSCDTTKNQIITTDNIEATVGKLKQGKDLDSLKIEILDNLLAISKGRDAYVKLQKSEYLQKYIIDDKAFKAKAGELFNYFSANKITYKILLTDTDSLNTMRDRMNERLQKVYEDIERFCIDKQKEVDKSEGLARNMKDSLNQMVKIKLLSIQETEIDYKDVIEVMIQMTNMTSTRIEAIAFDLELTDKLGSVIATLGCKSNNGFSKTDVKYWYYDRWESSDIYKSLKNTSASHVTARQEITRLNIGGNLLSAYSDNFTLNMFYKTPAKLEGDCPYLTDGDELKQRVKEEREKMFKEAKEKLKALVKYNEFSGEVLDFSLSN